MPQILDMLFAFTMSRCTLCRAWLIDSLTVYLIFKKAGAYLNCWPEPPHTLMPISLYWRSVCAAPARSVVAGEGQRQTSPSTNRVSMLVVHTGIVLGLHRRSSLFVRFLYRKAPGALICKELVQEQGARAPVSQLIETITTARHPALNALPACNP